MSNVKELSEFKQKLVSLLEEYIDADYKQRAVLVEHTRRVVYANKYFQDKISQEVDFDSVRYIDQVFLSSQYFIPDLKKLISRLDTEINS